MNLGQPQDGRSVHAKGLWLKQRLLQKFDAPRDMFPAGPARNLTGGSCVRWPDTGRFKRKIGWSVGVVELEGLNALNTNLSMKGVPRNQVASSPEATRTFHEKTRCHFEGAQCIGEDLL